jgi:hypothetical protein
MLPPLPLEADHYPHQQGGEGIQRKRQENHGSLPFYHSHMP